MGTRRDGKRVLAPIRLMDGRAHPVAEPTTVTGAMVVPGELWEPWCALEERKQCVELDLVAGVLSDTARGIGIATRETVTCGLFDCADLQIIFAAALVVGDRGKLAVLRLARRALREEGRWDDEARAFERNGRWSDASLADLAWAHPGPALVAPRARELIDLTKRMARIAACWREAKTLLLAGCNGPRTTDH